MFTIWSQARFKDHSNFKKITTNSHQSVVYNRIMLWQIYRQVHYIQKDSWGMQAHIVFVRNKKNLKFLQLFNIVIMSLTLHAPNYHKLVLAFGTFLFIFRCEVMRSDVLTLYYER